jgi:hypothetical protein
MLWLILIANVLVGLEELQGLSSLFLQVEMAPPILFHRHYQRALHFLLLYLLFLLWAHLWADHPLSGLSAKTVFALILILRLWSMNYPEADLRGIFFYASPPFPSPLAERGG